MANALSNQQESLASSEADALLERLRTLPEAEAVRCYAGLSSRWQWFARQRLTGLRRAALIAHHATNIAGCK